MLTQTGRLKLIDFGIAREFKASATKDTKYFVSVGYSPPEQYGTGQTDARSDIYSLGATIHQLLTQRDPANDPFMFPPLRSINPAVSGNMESIVAKCLQIDRTQRYPTVAEVRDALLPLLSTIISPVDGAEMLLIPKGEFLMGTSDEQINELLLQFPAWKREGFASEQPQHRVYLDDFYIDKYPVTNARFEQFVKATGYKAEGDWRKHYTQGKEKQPVVNVSWNDANAYCK